jgi:hypothetical protein
VDWLHRRMWITPLERAALMIDMSLHSWPCAEKRKPPAAESRPIRGLVRRNGARKRRITPHSWPCAEKRYEQWVRATATLLNYEVHARHKRAYSPSASTSS